jgi:carbamate kinase
VRVVVAFGGKVFLRRGEPLRAANRRANARVACRALAPVALEQELVISHGNGPRVGLLALRGSASTAADPYPLDLFGAQSEGMFGYLIRRELGNELPFERRLASLLTLIEVDPDDPAFKDPTKPIGPVYAEEEAAKLGGEEGWVFEPDGDCFRRVVPSPLPRRIFGIERVGWLLEQGAVVICAGGGGIPVVCTDAPATRPAARGGGGGDRPGSGERVACEGSAGRRAADRDRRDASTRIGARAGGVRSGGRPRRRLPRPSSRPARWGGRVRVACSFVEGTGGLAAIGSISETAALLGGEGGTIVTLDASGLEVGAAR